MTGLAAPFSTEIIRTKFQSMVDEMNVLLARSAFSTHMRESRDCSYQFLDAEGNLIVTPGSLTHAFAFKQFVRSVWRVYGREDMKPGDLYISNHPYESFVHHAPDLAVMTPVFYDGELVAYSCSAAHKPDFGGAMPGSSYSGATELIQEGFLLPIVRYARRGRVVDEITRIIETNVRNPYLVLGDMNAQIGITKTAAKRFQVLMDQLGKQEVLRAFAATLDGTERLFEAYLDGWEDGSYSSDVWLDDDGSGAGDPVRMHATATKRDGRLDIDFTGTDPQTRGPANMVLSTIKSSVTNAVISLVDPSFPFNDGMWRRISLRFGERTVVSPEYPSPVGNSTQSAHRLVDLLVETLSKFQPQKRLAHSGGSGGTLALSWPAGVVGPHAYTHYEILGAATAGSNQGDGESGITTSAGSLSLTPIEIIETAAPVRVVSFELVPDSGGPGKFRGGLSYRRVYEVLEPAKLNRRADRVKVPPSGSDGGKPGRTGEFRLHPGTPREQSFGGSGFYTLEAGDTFAVAAAGGGGYGDPFERAPEAVLADVRAGWVSVEGAARDYGVAIVDGPNGHAIDDEATTRLRSR